MATVGTELTFGIQECSKCNYKLRCDECVYNGKSIETDARKTAKEIYEKVLEWCPVPTDGSYSRFIECFESWLKEKYGFVIDGEEAE